MKMFIARLLTFIGFINIFISSVLFIAALGWPEAEYNSPRHYAIRLLIAGIIALITGGAL